MNVQARGLHSPIDEPVQSFSHCHEGILAGLDAFQQLPPVHDAAQRARRIAQQTVLLMDDAVLRHHAEEEDELFTAVERSAVPGAERERVKSLVSKLTDDHRAIEALWKRMRDEVARIAAGKPAALRQDQVSLLLAAYRGHAQTEESEFLPLAQDILSRDGNHMAALGISLHLRHATVPVGYI